MSFHTGHHFYALCDHDENGGRCETSLVPTRVPDVFAPGAVIVARGEAYNAALEAGWEVIYLGNGEDRVLCPAHRQAPAKPSPSEIVDVPLFDLHPA